MYELVELTIHKLPKQYSLSGTVLDKIYENWVLWYKDEAEREVSKMEFYETLVEPEKYIYGETGELNHELNIPTLLTNFESFVDIFSDLLDTIEIFVYNNEVYYVYIGNIIQLHKRSDMNLFEYVTSESSLYLIDFVSEKRLAELYVESEEPFYALFLIELDGHYDYWGEYDEDVDLKIIGKCSDSIVDLSTKEIIFKIESINARNT